jgi:hypothetical protein
LRTRDKINELVRTFLEHLIADIHCMLCSKYDVNYDHEGEDVYYSLDDSRDTEAEVEAAIRLFPFMSFQQYGQTTTIGTIMSILSILFNY